MLPCRMLAKCYMVLQQYEEAFIWYRRNIEMFPDNQSVLVDLAEFYRRRRYYSAAIRCYKKAETLEHADRESLEEEIIETYKEMGLFDKAASGYQRMLGENPKNASVLCDYGDFLLYDQENVKEALRKYIEAMKCSGENTVSYAGAAFKAGVSCYYMGNMKKARIFLRRSLKGYLSLYGSIEKYISIPGVSPVRCYIIGSIYLYMGDVRKAEMYYSRAAGESFCEFCEYKECYEYMFVKGGLLSLKGDITGAAHCYQKALELEPNYAAARFELNRLYSKKKRWRDWT